MVIINTSMIMQQQSNEELCNLLIQGLVAKDEKLLQKVLEQEDEAVIKDIINKVPVNHVRKLIIELSNLLSTKVTLNHLGWLQLLLSLKSSVISSMADGRSILLPLLSLLEDRSSPDYYIKMQGLKGKLTLLKQLKESRRSDIAETVVRVQDEPETPAQMEVDSETDTESENDFEDDEPENEQEDDDDLLAEDEERGRIGHADDDDDDDDDDDEDDEDDEKKAGQSDEDI